MSPRDRLALEFLVTGRKLLSARINALALSGLVLLLAYFWAVDSFRLGYKAFLYLFPYLFLFFSQDMSRDEIDSGALENVLFAGGRFRKYLLAKNAVVASSALGLSLIIFSAFSVYALFARQFELHAFIQLGAGVLAGLYYVAAAGFLSLFLKGGSNVLLILLGQVLIFVGLLFTASQRMGLAGRLTASPFPGLAAELEFTAVSLVFPNSVVALRSWVAVGGLAFMTAVFLSLQLWKIASLELRRR